MMDSARYFDLLDESVPQVRVSACTLALLEFFQLQLTLTPFFLQFIYILFELLGERSSQPSDWLPFGDWGKMSECTLEGGASRVRVTSSDDSRVDRSACSGSPSSSRLFQKMVRWRDG